MRWRRCRAEARWLAHKLGPARDLDVLADETLPAIAAAVRSAGTDDGAPALRSLRTRVARLRRAARAEARAAVASPRFVQFLLAIGAFAARPRFGVDEARRAGHDARSARARVSRARS